MSVQEDMQNWLKDHGEVKLSEGQAQQVEKKSKGCFTCQQKGVRAIVALAAFKVYQQKLEEDKMGQKIVVVVNDGCPPCDEVLNTLKPAVEGGEIEIININTCEEKDLEAIRVCGIEAYPSMTLRRDDGSFSKPMNLSLRKTEGSASEITVQAEEPEEPELEESEEQAVEEAEPIGDYLEAEGLEPKG